MLINHFINSDSKLLAFSGFYVSNHDDRLCFDRVHALEHRLYPLAGRALFRWSLETLLLIHWGHSHIAL